MDPSSTESPKSVNDIPEQCLCIIFSHLSSSDLRKAVPLVCKRWSVVIRSNPYLITSVTLDFRLASERQTSVSCGSRTSARLIPCKRRIKSRLARYAEYIKQLTVRNTENHGPEEACALRLHDYTVHDWSKLLHMLPNLTSLSLSHCNDVLPNLCILSDLTNLQDLCLDKVSISFASDRSWIQDQRLIPGSGYGGAPLLGSLTNLTKLTIGMDPPTADGLQKVPDTWSSLLKLKELTLTGHYQLKSLPRWMRSLTGLQSVCLMQCDVTVLPSVLVDVSSLTSMDLSGNQLVQAWQGLGLARCPTQLRHLRLKDCELEQLPHDIARFSNLISLDMSCNPLATGKSQLGWQSCMESEGLFADIQYCVQLEMLDLSHCSLDIFPSGIPYLSSLKVLNLSHNPGMTVSEENLVVLTSLPNLLDLNLHHVAVEAPARPGRFMRSFTDGPWRIESLTDWDSSHTPFPDKFLPAGARHQPSNNLFLYTYRDPGSFHAYYNEGQTSRMGTSSSANPATDSTGFAHCSPKSWHGTQRPSASASQPPFTAPGSSPSRDNQRDQHSRREKGKGSQVAPALSRSGASSTLNPRAPEFVPGSYHDGNLFAFSPGSISSTGQASGSNLFPSLLTKSILMSTIPQDHGSSSTAAEPLPEENSDYTQP